MKQKRLYYRIFKRVSWFLVLFGLSAQTAFGQVQLESAYITFNPDHRPVRNFIVRNTSKGVLWVKTEIFEIARPGFPDQEEVSTQDVILTPKRFPIPPNGQKNIRILSRVVSPSTQRVFRCRFTPERPPIISDEALLSPEEKSAGKTGDKADPQQTPEKKKDKGNRSTLGVTLLTGMGGLIFINPPDPSTKIEVQREGKTFKITNVGNVNFMMFEPKACKNKRKDECHSLADRPRRIYANNVVTFENVGTDEFVTYRKEVLGSAIEEVILK